MNCAGGIRTWHVHCILEIVGTSLATTRLNSQLSPGGSRNELLPKTPRLAGCGATSPLFFCLAPARQRVQIHDMDGRQLAAVHEALVAVQQAVVTMTFPSCDQEDLIELIDRVEGELHAAHPNLALMCTFLNSIARSLRAQPEARDACLTIEGALGAAGVPSTWQSGI